MTSTTDQIREALAAAQAEFIQINPADARRKTAPDAWSMNEVLGHLIDSAANNLQRVVRTAQNERGFPPYQQMGWVEVQRYNEMNWSDLVELFVLNNLHFCRVVDGLPAAAFDNPCDIGKDSPVTLRFVVDDYLRHLNLHIAQILDQRGG